MADKPVYSTATGSHKKDHDKPASHKPASGPTKMRFETKGRGGKAVTVLFNLPFVEDEARRIMRELQGALGCGATLKDSLMELQGDRRDKVEAYFVKHGMKIVRAGG